MQQHRSGLKNKHERAAKKRYDEERERKYAHVRDRLSGEFSKRNGARSRHVVKAPTTLNAQLMNMRNDKSRKRSNL